MARRKINTVDYFSHPVTGGKTLFILEERFGNDGYAFWFKLQELLGESNGHYYYCVDKINWRYLLAKTHVENKMAVSILDVLAELEEIDQELWDKRIIWSDNFITDLEAVYKNRKRDLPSKPSISTVKNNQESLFYGRNDTGAPIPTVEIPQSKVEYSKEEESKGIGDPKGKGKSQKPDQPTLSGKKDLSLKSLDKPEVLKQFEEMFPDIDVPSELEKYKDDLKKKGKRWKDNHAAFRNWLRQPWVPKTAQEQQSRTKLIMCTNCYGTEEVPLDFSRMRYCPICTNKEENDWHVLQHIKAAMVDIMLAEIERLELAEIDPEIVRAEIDNSLIQASA